MSFKLISDSCCDIDETQQFIPVERIPLSIHIGDTEYLDDDSLDTGELLKTMGNSAAAAKTACPPPDSYTQAYDCDSDDVYVVTLSANLSGSHHSAVLGQTVFEEERGQKNIHVFNSRSASAGQVAVCLKIQELAQQGKRFAGVIAETERFIEGLTTLFVLEDLENLRKSGRLSHLQALVTDMLKIKLVMGGERDGTIGLRGKALSVNRALARMVELIKEKCSDVSTFKRTLVITHCNCRERAERVKDMILSVCPFERIVICRASGVSMVYGGSGGIIVSF